MPIAPLTARRLSTLVPSAAVLALAALGTTAQAESGGPINDLRVGIDFLVQPEVTEQISLDSVNGQPGEKGSYTWEQGGLFDNPGKRVEIAYFQGMSRRDRATNGFVWALGLNYGWWDMTPDSYGNGDINAANTRANQNLQYKQFGAMFGAGYATFPRYTSAGDLHFELMPTFRGGWAMAETVTPGASPMVADGSAPWWEAGAKAAVVLMDEHWILDVHIGYAYGESHPNVSLPTHSDSNGNTVAGGTSKMDLITNSPYAGLMFGWRF